MSRFAVKRLAAVEIQPGASNQHELNAGALRTALGFPQGRSEGPLSLLYYGQGSVASVLLDGTFTLYDAREHHPTRSEYRLYYRLPGLADMAAPGDLLVLGRESETDTIQGVIAAAGSAMEQQLTHLFDAGDQAGLQRLVVREPAPLGDEDAGQWVDTLLPDMSAPALAEAARSHRLYAESVKRSHVPPTKEMARAGQEIAEAVWGSGLAPDDVISNGLDAESELYFAIEREVGTRGLHALLGAGAANLDEMLTWALRIQQSRKSRRGQSLQNHFAFLLDREGVPYAAQCPTERGETPDFVIPGHAQYHDPTFPAAKLRMIACKSTVRERWGQILKEAARIPEKYLLTVDPSMSADLIHAMQQAGLMAFLPKATIASHYEQNGAVNLVGTVGQLMGKLKVVL